jgi:hypothetical protein
MHRRFFFSSGLLVLLMSTAACAEAPSDEETESAVSDLSEAPGQAVFDEAGGWTLTRDDDFYVQRYKVFGDLIYCESRTIVWGEIDEAVALLQAPWTWYGGRVDDYLVHPDGRRTYRLWPAGRLGLVNVDEEMFPPERSARGVRIRIQLEGYGSGPAYIELRPIAPGKFEMFGRFAGVRSNVLPTAIFAEKHLEGEGGRLGMPFFQYGGGFEGLKGALARGEGRNLR